MKAKVLLRIAVFCVLFFVVGHSIGHFTRKDSTDPQAKAVFKSMEEYKFPIGPQMRSYDEFYTGMSFNLIISLIASAILLWVISTVVNESPNTAKTLLWPILLCMIGFSITGFLYFFVVPAVTCLVAAGLIAASIFSLNRKVGY